MEDSTRAVEDYLEPEVAVAVAVTAALGSPRARRVLRQGAVYSVAGVLKAGDAVGMFARGVGRGATRTVEEVPASADETDATDTGDAGEATAPAARRRAQRGGNAGTKRDEKAEGANK